MVYTIKSGNHYANTLPFVDYPYLPPKVHTGMSTMEGYIIFNKDCAYSLTDTNCINDVNKGYGFSYGNHMKWSIRIGWRVHDSGKLELFNFSHVNGKQQFKRVGGSKTYFEYDTMYYFKIEYIESEKIARVTVDKYFASIPFDTSICAGYDCRPYFGGDCKAPHEMNIEIILI